LIDDAIDLNSAPAESARIGWTRNAIEMPDRGDQPPLACGAIATLQSRIWYRAAASTGLDCWQCRDSNPGDEVNGRANQACKSHASKRANTLRRGRGRNERKNCRQNRQHKLKNKPSKQTKKPQWPGDENAAT